MRLFSLSIFSVFVVSMIDGRTLNMLCLRDSQPCQIVSISASKAMLSVGLFVNVCVRNSNIILI
ncbi:hypothetical protein PSEUDO9AZ_40689 [Pseudomonas sp. 9AZ]|nr:hypothetical protein PSEUDO9AZ_40689 [Pseudomonas sp. 9AZ]